MQSIFWHVKYTVNEKSMEKGRSANYGVNMSGKQEESQEAMPDTQRTDIESEYYKQALEEYEDLVQDDYPDLWDKRINDTGCYVQNLALQLCHAETNDWRQCFKEMEMFRKCWEQNGNRERVNTVDKE